MKKLKVDDVFSLPSAKQGRPINDIEYYGVSPWPDMQDLIAHCLQQQPAERPSAQEVFDRLCSSEFICLKRAIAVEHLHTVEAFVERVRLVWEGVVWEECSGDL